NVLQYGLGVGYVVPLTENVFVTPTLESVGWTFLGGQKFNPETGQDSASGDTVINIKPGIRVGFGDVNAPAGQQRHSVYFGWGHPIPSERLYKDIFRVEYRLIF